MKKKRWVSNVILLVAVLVFIGSGLYLLRYFLNARQTENELEELQQLKKESLEEDDQEDTTEKMQRGEGHIILKEYRKLYQKNDDLVGWMTVKNTKIDYPVMQTKKDSEYYLHRNFKKEEDINGLPFLDAKCDVEDPNSNLMVYGHHMKSGLMFAHLEDFEDKDFYKKHKTIEFDTLYEKRKYEVVAVFRSKVYKEDEDVFKYYRYGGPLSERQYDTYVKNCQKRSVHKTGVTPIYGEQLLTLVTCAYHTEDGRFVVVARRKVKG